MTLRIGKADIGDTVDARSGRVTARVEVRAAPWVDVTSVSIVQSGREVKRIAVPRSRQAVRLRAQVDLVVAADGWVVVRVEGEEPLAPIVGDRVRYDVRPFALTNPIFLDRDGNGRYDAPLLPRVDPPSMGSPSGPPPGPPPEGKPRRRE